MVNNYDNLEKFSFYKSFDDYWAWVEAEYINLPDTYFIKRYARNWTRPDREFVGSGDVDLLNSKIQTFIEPQILLSSVERIQGLFQLINLGGAFDKDRMVTTDMPIGVFDFGLASQGLYRLQEYYCPDLQQIIDPNLVKKMSDNPKLFTYTQTINDIKKTFICIQQQKGTREIEKKTAYVNELIEKGEDKFLAMEMGNIKFPNAKLIFRTTTKKVNLVRYSKTLKDSKRGNERYVDLFLRIGGSHFETPRTLLFRIMPSLLVSYFLDKAGIKTRILGFDTTAQESESNENRRNFRRYANAFVIKEYEDPFDFNEIAILSADSRTFRWKIFKAIGVQFGSDPLRVDSGSSLGYPINGEQYRKLFERYKEFYIQEQKTKSGIKNLNSRLMFTTELNVNRNRSDDEIMQDVETEFFRLIDAIDIEFNGARQALPRIRDREIARGTDITNLRTRLIGSITTTTNFDESNSKYSTKPEDISKRRNLRKELTNDINSTIKII